MVMDLKGRIFSNMAQKDAAKLNVALQSFRSGMNVLEHIGRKKSFIYSELLNDYGIALKKCGKIGESVSAFRALDIKKDLGMDSSLFYAMTLHNLANVSFVAGERRKALNLCRQSLALKERLGLSSAKTYAVSLNTLGVMCYASGSHDEAITAFNHGAKLFGNLGLKRTADFATNRSNAATAFRAKKEFREARSLYLEAQSIRERLRLDDSLDYAQTGLDLARMLHGDMNDSCAALEYAARALSVKKRFTAATESDNLLLEQIRASCSR
jgi:tetratricopeptide (TPR) repeat protein